MKLESVKLENNWLVYKGVALEDAEIKELTDVCVDMYNKVSGTLYSFALAVNECAKNISKGFSVFAPRFKTESIIMKYAPEYWLNRYSVK